MSSGDLEHTLEWKRGGWAVGIGAAAPPEHLGRDGQDNTESTYAYAERAAKRGFMQETGKWSLLLKARAVRLHFVPKRVPGEAVTCAQRAENRAVRAVRAALLRHNRPENPVEILGIRVRDLDHAAPPRLWA